MDSKLTGRTAELLINAALGNPISTPRQRNLWATDTVEWCGKLGTCSRRTRCRELRLFFVAGCLSNQFDLHGGRYAFSEDRSAGSPISSLRVRVAVSLEIMLAPTDPPDLDLRSASWTRHRGNHSVHFRRRSPYRSRLALSRSAAFGAAGATQVEMGRLRTQPEGRFYELTHAGRKKLLPKPEWERMVRAIGSILQHHEGEEV
jgi:hypothetical protein